MDNQKLADAINTLAAFCACRDLPALSKEALKRKYGFEQADVMVLFGGSIICGGDVLANAMQNGIAKKYIVVGGEGHTTQTLRNQMHACFPEVETENRTEAEIFSSYLSFRYGLTSDYLECASTNCGNNITNLLCLLRREQVPFQSIILCQDATMQRRMDATLRLYQTDAAIINFASYQVQVVVKNGVLSYDHDIWGIWDIPRYLTLLMGEIPRLRDDAQGYGPNGAGYISHVDIPQDVEEAFCWLEREANAPIRAANPAYATKQP